METKAIDYKLGCRLGVEDWIWLNRTGVFENPGLREFVSPFPPVELMQNVSGLEIEHDFASHGADLFLALSQASPIALTEYKKLLDFGCGCGRLARMFKNCPHELFGCDVDARHVDWIDKNLKYMKAVHSSVRPPLPYQDNSFDGIISVSVFTHLNETSQDEFLMELYRVSQPGARLFLTVHGDRALQRALTEHTIREMIWVDEELFQKARKNFAQDKHAFILQQGHLTTTAKKETAKSFLRRFMKRWRPQSANSRLQVREPFEYGIAFLSENYIRSHWSRWFEIQDFRHGAIHDFQDIIVLCPRKSA